MHTQSKFRLLVVRLGAMGDILHALPAVTALRQAHPRWHIDWVVEPAWAALLSAHPEAGERGAAQPLVDGVVPACTKAWGRRPLSPGTFRAIKSLHRRLGAGGYDAVVDFQGAVRSAFLARLTGSLRRIGESHPREWAAKLLFTERIETSGAHVIEQDVELACGVAGDVLEPQRPLLPVDRETEAWCDAFVASLGSEPIVLLNPGAGWGAKRWPVERYAEVAGKLSGQGFRVVVNAGPRETHLADAVQEQSGGRSVPLHCSLGELIAITRRVSLVIAGDTGPLHLACALGRPVVGIFGPTDPSRNGPFGSPFRVLRSPESRRDHTRHEAPEAGLLTIFPEDVLQAADELLAEVSAR